jgi:hypothetical protein
MAIDKESAGGNLRKGAVQEATQSDQGAVQGGKHTSEKLGKMAGKGARRMRGFASMSKEKVLQVSKNGGRHRALQLGREGYVALGRKGGLIRSAQLGHEGYVAMGQKGGLSRKKSRKKLPLV